MVMYRDFTCRNARSLGLVGEVKNLSNGTVCVIAEGPHDDLLKFIVRLHEGPMFSHVEDVQVKWTAITGTFSSFTIMY